MKKIIKDREEMQANNAFKKSMGQNQIPEALYIHGIGCFYPENIIDNQFLENLDIGTSNNWILERVGIHERRTVLPLDYIKITKNKDPRMADEAAIYSNAESGKIAAERALSAAHLEKEAIGLVIAGGCSPPYLIPANACLLANELNLNVPCIDLNSACSTFVAHLHFLSKMQTESLPDYILLVIVENTTRTVDYSDRNTAVLWGDAAVAVIVSKKHKSNLRLLDSAFLTDPVNWNKVLIPVGKHFYQQGSTVQAFAIRKSIETGDNLLQQTELAENIEHLKFIGHQGNLLMLQSIAQRLGIINANHLFNVDKYGNCGAAGAPSVLAQYWDNFKANDTILMTIVGSGFSWGGLLLQFLN